jgi:glutathione S-transferase
MATTLAPQKVAAKKKAAAAPTEPTPSAVMSLVPKAPPKSAPAVLTITSKNYSSWSLRGWLLVRFAGLEFTEKVLPPDDPSTRAEILLLSSSNRVPDLVHEGVHVWDTLAIAEYLNELSPEAGLLPTSQAARAHCRAICGEMHSGFASLRSSLPMNLRASFPKFKIWSRAQADIDRITIIWRECLDKYGGPYLFGPHRTMADAMFLPVCTRLRTYDVKLDAQCSAYCDLMLAEPEFKEWLKGAKSEPDDIDELDVEF